MQNVSLHHRMRVARTQLRTRAVDRALHAFVRVRYALPDALPARFDVAVRRNVPYRATGESAHMLDVYTPTQAGADPLPMLLYVHGGGFSMCSKDTHRVMALSYARRGYLVFNINYRLGPRHRFPVPFEDAAHALLWVKENGESLGGDPERLAIAGESAGANHGYDALVWRPAAREKWRLVHDFLARQMGAKGAVRAASGAGLQGGRAA